MTGRAERPRAAGALPTPPPERQARPWGSARCRVSPSLWGSGQVIPLPLPALFLPPQRRPSKQGTSQPCSQHLPQLTVPAHPKSSLPHFTPVSHIQLPHKPCERRKIPKAHPRHTDLAAAPHVGSLWLGPAQPCCHRCQDLGTRTTTALRNAEQHDPTGILQLPKALGQDTLWEGHSPTSLLPSQLPVTTPRHFWPLGKLQEITEVTGEELELSLACHPTPAPILLGEQPPPAMTRFPSRLVAPGPSCRDDRKD